MQGLTIRWGAISRYLWTFMVIINGLLFAFDSKATTVKQFELNELVAKSTLIFIGRCVSSESHWNSKRTLILTSSNFIVSESLKGPTNGSVNVTTVGGTLDGITQTVAGMPEFLGDEEVLLFLQPHSTGNWQVLGLSQGKFRIVNNPLTGEKETVRSLSGLTLYDSRHQKLSEDTRSSRMRLSELQERIRGLTKEQ